MKKLLIVLPGLHGDVVINLPAAKWWADQGWWVDWAVMDGWTYRALFSRISYVHPIFIKQQKQDYFHVVDAIAASGGYDKIIDLYRVGLNSPLELPSAHENSIINFRYRVAGVDPEERWKLSWRRDRKAEDGLYRRVVGKLGKYCLLHDETWCGAADVGHTELPVVRFRQVKPYGIFDWRKVIVNASEIRVLDSSLANLIEVIPDAMPIAKWVYLRKEFEWSSIYRSNWHFIKGSLPERQGYDYRIGAKEFHIPGDLVRNEPAMKRGEGRVLLVPQAGGAISVRRISDLPAIFRKRPVWVNNSRVRRGRFWLHRDSGHRMKVTLLRQVGALKWLAFVEGPRDLIVGARFWTADRTPVEVPEEWKLPHCYVLEFGRAPRFDAFANYFQPPTGRNVSTSNQETRDPHEPRYARIEGSAAPDTCGVQLSDTVLRRLEIHELTHHTDVSLAEKVDSEKRQPEWYDMAQAPNGKGAIAVGWRAARAIESSAHSGKRSGWTDLLIVPGFSFKALTGILLEIPLPQDVEFQLLAAFAGSGRAVSALRTAARAKMRFSRYGDLVLVM
jgi:S-adenosylmethionine:tRNA ribosyltransferase-isomerase